MEEGHSRSSGDAGKAGAQNQATGGMSQSNKDDLGVCIVIILITVLAIIVTVIKIVLIDVTQYPELFGRETTTASTTTTTTSRSMLGDNDDSAFA